MSKPPKRPVIESDSDDSGGSENLNKESQLQTPSVKRPKLATGPLAGGQSSGSGTSSENGSDNEWTLDGKSGGKKGKVSGLTKKGRGIARKKIVNRKSTSSSVSSNDDEDKGIKPFTAGGFTSSGGGQTSSSDSESSSGESLQFDDGLDDDLIGDDEDRTKLDLMTEAEREREKFNRFEKRQALKTRFEIEQRLRRERKAEKKRMKQRHRRSSRDIRGRPQDKNKSRAINELKARRSADKIRKAEAEKQLQQQKKEPLKASDVFSSGSDEESSSESESSSSFQGDSDDESGSNLRHEANKSIATLEQLNKIKLSRYRLEKWVHMPFFRETMIGCYVRIGIGAHEGKMVYRVCEVVNIQEGPKVYSLGSTKTNKTMRLSHAGQERQFRMEYVSNSPFSDTEFSKWLEELESQGLKPPTCERVQKKVKQIEASRNFHMKEEDIEQIVKEKQKFRKNPRNYAMTKNRLIREKELAEVEGDHSKAGQLSTKIDEIEERAEELEKQRTKGLSAISYINERNRMRNVSRAEQALKEELAATDKDVDDPFTRRKCQPTLVTLAVREGGGQGTVELLQQLSQSEVDSEAVKPSIEMAVAGIDSSNTANGQPTQLLIDTPTTSLLSTPAPPKNVEDLFSAHDFDIQIDLPSGSEVASSMKTAPKSTSTDKGGGPRRSLNLSDYKKRRGLI